MISYLIISCFFIQIYIRDSYKFSSSLLHTCSPYPLHTCLTYLGISWSFHTPRPDLGLLLVSRNHQAGHLSQALPRPSSSHPKYTTRRVTPKNPSTSNTAVYLYVVGPKVYEFLPLLLYHTKHCSITDLLKIVGYYLGILNILVNSKASNYICQFHTTIYPSSFVFFLCRIS